MDQLQEFKSIRSFVDHVGRDKLRAEGAYPQVINNWYRRDGIPASWIPIFTSLYDGKLPLHLFRVRQTKTTGAAA